jgi:hypothetical protein
VSSILGTQDTPLQGSAAAQQRPASRLGSAITVFVRRGSRRISGTAARWRKRRRWRTMPGRARRSSMIEGTRNSASMRSRGSGCDYCLRAAKRRDRKLERPAALELHRSLRFASCRLPAKTAAPWRAASASPARRSIGTLPARLQTR